MRALLYPFFGLLVLSGYYVIVSRGVDPFATPSEVHAATGPDAPSRARGGGVFLYGGFHGGK